MVGKNDDDDDDEIEDVVGLRFCLFNVKRSVSEKN